MRTTSLLALSLSLSLVLVACGGDDSKSAATPPASTPAAGCAEPTDDAVMHFTTTSGNCGDLPDVPVDDGSDDSGCSTSVNESTCVVTVACDVPADEDGVATSLHVAFDATTAPIHGTATVVVTTNDEETCRGSYAVTIQ